VILSFISVTLAAPHALILKLATNAGIDNFSFIAIRALLVLLICAPFLIRSRQKLAKNWKLILLSNIFIGIASISHIAGVRVAPASYTSVIGMFSPIIFLIISAAFIKERMSLNKIFGIAIAFVGAAIMFALPLLLDSHNLQIYPESIIFNFINITAFAFTMVIYRKIYARGVPIVTTMGSSWFLVFIVATILSLTTNSDIAAPISIMINNPIIIFCAFYSSIMVEIVSHGVRTHVYKKVGAFVISAASFFGKVLGVILPLIILRESLSIHVIIGAIVTLVGIAIIDKKPKDARKNLQAA
jgi:drug/metabolite transporter (DMT)-like permease